jgi:hypothetical protein
LNSPAIAVIVTAIVAVGAFFLLVPPIPQDPAYHDFADSRVILGIPNFWNVVSNLPFLVVGLWGTAFVFRHGRTVCAAGLELAYVVFFAGIVLTSIGSAYYHLNPANEPLVWDRLPMTIAFAGLFSIIIGEYFSPRLARAILIPLLLLGALSVEFWAYTEARGMGDLRAYVIFQFLPLILVPFILLLRQPVIGDGRYFWIMLLLYVVSKIVEFLDTSIYAAGGLIGGHSLKHFFAALAAATLLYGLSERRALSVAANDD